MPVGFQGAFFTPTQTTLHVSMRRPLVPKVGSALLYWAAEKGPYFPRVAEQGKSPPQPPADGAGKWPVIGPDVGSQ